MPFEPPTLFWLKPCIILGHQMLTHASLLARQVSFLDYIYIRIYIRIYIYIESKTTVVAYWYNGHFCLPIFVGQPLNSWFLSPQMFGQ